MKKVVFVIITALCTTTISFAQSKKEMLSSIISLNQQVAALTVKGDHLSEQVKELQNQVEQLEAFIATTNESQFINTGWTKKGDFIMGLARVQDDTSGLYGYIDKSGKLVIPCKWKSVSDLDQSYFRELIMVKDNNGNWGAIDKTGKIVIPCKWPRIRTFWSNTIFYKELVQVQDNSGNWGVIDETGEIIIPCKWSSIIAFEANTIFKELIKVKDNNGNWGVIDKTGKIISPCKWSGISAFGADTKFNELIKVKDNNGNLGVIDKTGKIIIPCKYFRIDIHRNPNRLTVQQDGYGGYKFLVDNMGREYPYHD